MRMVDMVVLANSRKVMGRCVAGLWVDKGSITSHWIRPISNHGSGELYDDDRRAEDGTLIEALDVVQVPLDEAHPGCHQPENVLLAAGVAWRRLGKLPLNELAALVETPSDIWLPSSTSTFFGQRDRVPHPESDKHSFSLTLIHVWDLSLEVLAPKAKYGDSTRRVYGTFTYESVRYTIRVTDVGIEDDFTSQGDGTYDFGSAYLVLSVGEVYKGDSYKLIATVIKSAK